MQVIYTEGLNVLEPHEREDIARIRDMLCQMEGLILPGILVGNGRQAAEVDALLLLPDVAVALELKSCSGIEIEIPSSMVPMRFRYASGEQKEFDNPIPGIERKSKIVGSILREWAQRSNHNGLFCHSAVVFSSGSRKWPLKLELGQDHLGTFICMLHDLPNVLDGFRRRNTRPLSHGQLNAVADSVLGASRAADGSIKTVGNYRILRESKSFSVGNAACFVGEEIGTGVGVFLLRLPRDVFQELPNQVQTAFRDAIVLSRLSGMPNIARYRGYVEHREYTYIVVNREKGVRLDQWLHDHVADEFVSLDWVGIRIRILRGILEGLRSLQSEGITRRDLRAENVFLTDSLEPRLFHFEAAKIPNVQTTPDQLRRHHKQDQDDLDAWARLAVLVLSRWPDGKSNHIWSSEFVASAPNQEAAKLLVKLVEQIPTLKSQGRPSIDNVIACVARCASSLFMEQAPVNKETPMVKSEEFQPTRWTKLNGALQKSKEGLAPRENSDLAFLLQMYDGPIHAILERLERRYTHKVCRAEDWKQEFLERNFLLDPDWLAKPSKERGRFRDFLAVALRNFLLNKIKTSSRLKNAPTEGAKQFPASNEPDSDSAETEVPSIKQIEHLLSRERAFAIVHDSQDRLRKWARSESTPDLVAQVDLFVEGNQKPQGSHRVSIKKKFEAFLRDGVREELGSISQEDLYAAIGREIKVLLKALAQPDILPRL